MVEIKIDEEKCDGCGTCVDTCPVEVFEIREEESVVVNLDEQRQIRIHRYLLDMSFCGIDRFLSRS